MYPAFPPLPHLLLAAALAVMVALGARAVRALTPSGAVAAAGIGFLLFGLGGWPGAAALLLFFVSSSALSRLGKRRKAELAFEKGGERDAGQALANGGVAALFALLLPFFPQSQWPVAGILGALATANADTWATELGSLAKGEPRMITSFRPAPTGSSGAISLPGTMAALAGAALIAATAWLWKPGLTLFLAASLAGFAGALFDSLLGATVQAQYRCPVCERLTEVREHCGTSTTLARGFPILNNDAVNSLATLFGALTAVCLTFYSG